MGGPFYQVVVAIHDGMDRVVHRHEVKTGGGLGGVGMPAEEEDGDVVVPVQELYRWVGGWVGGLRRKRE